MIAIVGKWTYDKISFCSFIEAKNEKASNMSQYSCAVIFYYSFCYIAETTAMAICKGII